jgi:hypothetical protein
MKRAVLVGCLFLALCKQAVAAPQVTIVDPGGATSAVVVNGHLQMDMPSGVVVTQMPTTAMNTATGSSGATSLVQCDQTARISALSASTVLIAHATGKTTYVCSYSFSVGLVVSISAGLVWGTGSTCGSNQAVASPVLAVGLSILAGQLATLGGGLGAVDQSPTAGTSDYCLITTGSPAATGVVRYAQF